MSQNKKSPVLFDSSLSYITWTTINLIAAVYYFIIPAAATAGKMRRTQDKKVIVAANSFLKRLSMMRQSL